jgi:hypothetical protein
MRMGALLCVAVILETRPAGQIGECVLSVGAHVPEPNVGSLQYHAGMSDTNSSAPDTLAPTNDPAAGEDPQAEKRG